MAVDGIAAEDPVQAPADAVLIVDGSFLQPELTGIRVGDVATAVHTGP